MSDDKFIETIAAVRTEAIRRWGERPVMKHGAEVGSIRSFHYNHGKTIVETYTAEDEAKEIADNMNTGWVRPRWEEMLEPLLTVDENAIELLKEMK